MTIERIYNNRNREDIQAISDHELSRDILRINDSELLRRIALERFGSEAKLLNKDLTSPFIRWPAINVDMQDWLPILLAKVAKAEFNNLLPEKHLLVVPIPASSTSYRQPIIDAEIFQHGTHFPLVLKEKQFEEYHISPGDKQESKHIDISSYVHARNPDNSRGKQTMYFFNPSQYSGKSVLLIDDAVAQGNTLVELATFLREDLGVEHIFCASPMAKKMQGGIQTLEQSKKINGLSVLIEVTEVSLSEHPMTYHSNGYYIWNNHS